MLRIIKKLLKQTIIVIAIFLVLFFLFGEKISGPKVSLNGISPMGLADDIFSKYDTNSDELLNVTSESFLRVDLDGTRKSESHGLLFTDVDNFGNKDGMVTKLELIQFLLEFDKDGDGELTTYKNIVHSIRGKIRGEKSEWYAFDQKYGERYKYE